MFIQPEELHTLQQFIATQTLLPRGIRPSSMFRASIKISGWSVQLEEELGVGYQVMLINSLGEQFVDQQSTRLVWNAIKNKTIDDARLYINKMATTNKLLLAKVANGEEVSVTEFGYLLTYFLIVRLIIENIYQNVSANDQKKIDEWRNDSSLFSSLDMYTRMHEEQDPPEWSLVGKAGTLVCADKLVRYMVESKDINTTEISGAIAYPGVVVGKARVVLSREERDSVEEGEIIVAPMTTVDFLVVMHRASAYVTDEGGITSHAAIVARELKKPCILNTKIGTKVIKTGDVIEVDADRGVVKIIKRA